MRKRADKSRMWVSWNRHNELMVLNKQRWGPGVDFWIPRPQETPSYREQVRAPCVDLFKTCLSKSFFRQSGYFYCGLSITC